MTCASCFPSLVSPSCPQCRGPLTSQCPGTLVSRLLMSNNILVSCIHGCGVKDTLDLVGKHEDSCMMGMVKCNNQGCLSRVMFREMQEHLQNCIYRPMACPCCKESFSTKAWTSGHPNCFKRLEGGKLRLESAMIFLLAVGKLQCLQGLSWSWVRRTGS